MYDAVIECPAGIVLNLSPTFGLCGCMKWCNNSQQVRLHSGIAVSYLQGYPAEAARYRTILLI